MVPSAGSVARRHADQVIASGGAFQNMSWYASMAVYLFEDGVLLACLVHVRHAQPNRYEITSNWSGSGRASRPPGECR